MKNIDLNNLQKTSKEFLNNKTAFNNIKTVYNQYVNKMNKSDFANSITRYEVELNLLNSLEGLAKKENNQNELEFILKNKENVLKKLKDLGITIKQT